MMKSKMMAGGGMMKKMASGGMPMVMKDGKKVPAFAADGEGKMAKGGMAKAKMMAGGGVPKKLPSPTQMGSIGMKAGGAVGYKAGGAAKRADGVAKKGHTKGKMLRGGGAC